MFGIFKMKAVFLGLLLASPPVAAWMLRSPAQAEPLPSPPQAPVAVVAESQVRIPVEVVTKGAAPQWVYVQVAPQSVPEPGPYALLALSSLLLLHRRRGK